MTALARLLQRREPTLPVDDLNQRRQERLAQHFLYGGRRTIDVAPIEAPASPTSSGGAAHHESSDGGQD